MRSFLYRDRRQKSRSFERKNTRTHRFQRFASTENQMQRAGKEGIYAESAPVRQTDQSDEKETSISIKYYPIYFLLYKYENS